MHHKFDYEIILSDPG